MLVLNFCNFSSVSRSFFSDVRKLSSEAFARESARLWQEWHRFWSPTSYCLKYSFCERKHNMGYEGKGAMSSQDTWLYFTTRGKQPSRTRVKRLQWHSFGDTMRMKTHALSQVLTEVDGSLTFTHGKKKGGGGGGTVGSFLQFKHTFLTPKQDCHILTGLGPKSYQTPNNSKYPQICIINC